MPPEPADYKLQAKREAERRSQRPPDQPPHLRLQLVQSGILFDLDTREKIVIGRADPDQQPDVDLAPYGGVEQGVGRRHALITLNQGRYYIEDLKSINETLLNSSRLFPGQPYPLEDGDILRFGAMLVKVLL
jgi:pSer/pThr/pTyr-binding forkhead associated (FHA) protein